MNIAWGISGAGYMLRESFETMYNLSKSHRITAFLSSSAEEVIEIYGLMEKLGMICDGSYLREIFKDREEGASSVHTGRFYFGKYDLLVISPATTNTIAKIAHGISDTLVTNAATHAMKAKVPVYVCPTDIKETTVELPYSIDLDVCKKCEICIAEKVCERGAIRNFRIDVSRCNSCGICEEYCPYNAIKKKKFNLEPRDVDLENLEKIRKMGICILSRPDELYEVISLYSR